MARPLSRGQSGTLFAACFAIFVSQIANVTPAPVVGYIQQSLGANGVALAWVTSAFLLPTAILELSFGVLGDLFGRKRVMLGGSVLMIAGSLVSGSAHSVQQLWAGQAITGIGAGAIIPTSLAVAVAGEVTAARRARGVALWTLSLSVGTMSGVVISGAVGQESSWHWSFYAVAPMALLALLVTLLLARESRSPEGRSLDWRGQLCIAVGLFSLLYGIVQGAGSRWSAPEVVAALTVGAVGVVAFFVVEGRVRAPMLHLSVFRVPAFSVAAAAAIVGMFSFMGCVYTLSIRLGTLQHKTPLASAVFFVILQGLPCVVGPLLPRAMRRFGARRLVAGGLVVLAAGQFWLASLPLSQTSLWDHLGPLLLEGIGFLFLVSAMTAAAVGAVPLSATGMASAAISTARDFGMCIGPSVISAIALSAATSALPQQIASSGLTPAQAAVVSHVGQVGGPFALLGAPLGPMARQAAAAGAGALSHGFSVGLVVCGIAALLAAAATALWLREAEPAAQGARPESAQVSPAT